MTDAVVVATTTSSRDEADRLAELAVERRLAACAQISPIESVYRWEGEVQRANEWRVEFKTTEAASGTLAATLAIEHSYDNPEVVAVRVVGASEQYLAWLRDAVSSAET